MTSCLNIIESGWSTCLGAYQDWKPAENSLPGPFQENFVGGSIFFFSRPVADLPIQPLVGLSNPNTPLISFLAIRAIHNAWISNGKNKWTVVRQVYGYYSYILRPSKVFEQLKVPWYSYNMSGSTGCNMSQQSSITSGDIPSEAPKKFVIGGGRTAGGIDGLLLWGIGCSWSMSRLRRLARRVNVTTPSNVRCRSAGAPWACRGRGGG